MQASSSRYKADQPNTLLPNASDSGSDSESDYSSSDVTEDENGDELTPALDAAILRTLSKIKTKQGVYGGERVLEEELREAQERANQKGLKNNVVKRTEEKPYRLTDYHRVKLLSGGDDNAEDGSPEPLSHVQSERLMRQEAVSAFKSFGEEEEDEAEGFELQKRDKDEEEEEEDEEEYRKFLLEMGGGEDAVRKILGMGDQPVSRVLEDAAEDAVEASGKREKLSKAEKKEKKEKDKKEKEQKNKDDDDFLMNYILNRGWIDRSGKHVPTYDEITGRITAEGDNDDAAPSDGAAGSSSHPWGELEDEDEFDDRAEQFETEYNFRFEEPGASAIVTHPRDIPSLVRRPDDARKLKRAARAERKAAEKAAKEEEARKLKGQKRREMEKRMASLKADLAGEGVDGVDWDQLEKVLDGEWNEDEWEKVVGGMLSKANEEEDEDEDGKPVWNDDLDDMAYDDVDGQGEGEDMDVDGQYNEEYGYDEEDAPINMDADFLESEPSKKKRKKNKKGKGRDQPEEDYTAEEPGLSVVEKASKVKEAMEAYRSLDHEDVIGGDLETRFKYTTSEPVSYGMTPVEILLATDEELNKVLSMKSIAPYRRGGIGLAGKGLNKRVRDLKQDLGRRKWGQETLPEKERERQRDNGYAQRGGERSSGPGGEDGHKRPGKRMGKKERLRAAKAAIEGQQVQPS